MVRPCFLVIDQEHSGNISTRKLVIETAKFNVITVYSGSEALETLRAFPNIFGIVLDSAVRDMGCDDLVTKLKEQNEKLPIVVISAPRSQVCRQADYTLDTFDPVPLLALLQSLVPAEASAVERHNEQLHRERE